jgi:peptidoglycan/LPS O-acetylase OafA/YrhL
MAPVFAALVAALAFSPRFWLDRLLSWSPLALVGIVSYEIYLSHVVVFRVLDRLHLDRWLTLYYVICLTLSIAVGWLFHRLFGKPTQRVVRAWLSAGRAGG